MSRFALVLLIAALMLMLYVRGGAAPDLGGLPAAGRSAEQSLDTRRRQVTYQRSRVDVEVGPVVLNGSDAFVRVSSRVTDGPAITAASMYPQRTSPAASGPGLPLRVLDLENGTTHDATATSAGRSAQITAQSPAVWYARVDSAGLQAGKKVAVMLTSVGIVDGVAVRRAGEDGAFNPPSVALQDADPAWKQGATSPLEATYLATDDSSDTTVSQDRMAVSLSADVLFATDSAQLTPRADGVLRDVAAHLELYTGGSLAITGHTDDVGDEAYNQKLSERRAASVHAGLGKLTNLGRFQSSAAGRGERAPRVAGTSPAARRANRRVEIVVNPSGMNGEARAPRQDTPLPAPSGVSGEGRRGVVVTEPDGTRVRLEIDRVRRVNRYLLGEVRVTAESGRQASPAELMSYGSQGSPGPAGTAGALTLLTPGRRVPPVQYRLGSPPSRFTVTDPFTRSLEQGQAQVLSFVWPDTGEDTVTLAYEHARRGGKAPFRITGVPVRGR